MAVLFKNEDRQRRVPPDDPEEYRLTLVEHLEELRDRIIRSLIILGVAWVIGWIVEPHLYGLMTDRMVAAIKTVIKNFVYIEVFFHAADPFLLKVKLSFFLGLIPAFPLVLLQLWGFIEPALKPSERAPVRRVAPYSLLLFAIGATFAWLVLPQAMAWFCTYVEEFPGVQGIHQEAGTLAFFVLKMMLAFGVAFQLPLVVYIMGAIGLLKADTLLQYWRQAATAIFIISMIITPSNDPATMLMMAIPLVILFIISVYAVKISENRKRRLKRAEATDDELE